METLAPWAEPVLMTAEELLQLPEDEWRYRPDILGRRGLRSTPPAGYS